MRAKTLLRSVAKRLGVGTIASLRLLSPGLCTLLVDRGRPGYRGLGVPAGGAADRFALAIGNALVGNPPDTAALEISLNGPTLTTDSNLACVLYGAPFEMTIDGLVQESGKTFTLPCGEELRIGGTPRGMRAYDRCSSQGFGSRKCSFWRCFYRNRRSLGGGGVTVPEVVLVIENVSSTDGHNSSIFIVEIPTLGSERRIGWIPIRRG